MKLIQQLGIMIITLGMFVQSGCSQTTKDAVPQYLYKILSTENWQASQEKNNLVLSSDDDAFIHFSTADQLERIASKYWAHVPEFVVLTIDTTQLPGAMVFEANPGGENKYYHLYNGSIPLIAVVDVKVRKN